MFIAAQGAEQARWRLELHGEVDNFNLVDQGTFQVPCRKWGIVGADAGRAGSHQPRIDRKIALDHLPKQFGLYLDWIAQRRPSPCH